MKKIINWLNAIKKQLAYNYWMKRRSHMPIVMYDFIDEDGYMCRWEENDGDGHHSEEFYAITYDPNYLYCNRNEGENKVCER